MSSYYEKFLATGKVKCIDEEIPFEIPQGWKWCRLSGAVNIIMGQSPNGNDVFEANEVDNAYEFHQGKICFTDKYIAPAGKWCKEPSRIANIGSLLVCVRAPIGDVNITQRQIGIGRGLAAINGYNGIKSDFLFYWLLAHKKMLVDKGTGSTFKAITVEVLKDLIIPIPPLSEQQRIVSKLEEILSFVEHYEQLHNEINSLNAVIYEQLRKSILQEAIQGKLVPQIAEEGTAQELYEQVKAEKQKLVKEGKLKKSALTDSVIYKGDDNKYYDRINKEVVEIELPCDYPNSWCVVRLKDVCQLIDGVKMTGKGICLDAKYLRCKSSPTYLDKGRFVRVNDNIILVDGENSGEVLNAPVDGYMVSTFKQLWLSTAMYKPYLLAFILFYKEALRNSKRGAAIPHLNKELFYNLPIGIPPYQEQERIAQRIDALFKLLK